MNTFGNLFRVTTFGESHGGALGCVIDGCPPNLELTEADIQPDLDRRKPGQSAITTQRKEADQVHIVSGTFEGKTLGTPICMLVWNQDAKPEDYQYLKDKYRPSHADYTYDKKYGHRAWAGGGRASARETTARVMAGAVAKKLLKQYNQTQILAYISRIKDIQAQINHESVTPEQIESNIVRCPDPVAAEKMISLITQMKDAGNSVGGVVECLVRNVPIGLGEPVFDKIDAELSHALLSIPATKGFEIGSGFGGTYLTGKQHNDEFYTKYDGSIGTTTNDSGGSQGGITNGENLILRVAFKPTSTIMQTQQTVNNQGEQIKLENIKGRHDPCVTPRAVPIVEAMVALTLIDHYLRHKAQNG
jgi:chorismate synthase